LVSRSEEGELLDSFTKYWCCTANFILQIGVLITEVIAMCLFIYTPCTCIAATTPELTVGILNSVFYILKKFKFLNNSVTLARYKSTP